MTDRRAFLRGALTAGIAGATGAAAGVGLTIAADGNTAAQAGVVASAVPFHGARQAGVTTPGQAHGTVLACDVLAPDRAALTGLMREITDKARSLTAGGRPADPGIATPPTDSGVLGPVVPADGLTVTVGVGASLFDGRYGLAARRPGELVPMATFSDDHLDPALCHGDLSIQVCADNRDTVGHAIREIARATRGALAVRWRVDGFRSPPRPSGTPRNLLGFKDGTSNLDNTVDAATRDRLVWLPASGAPAGGSAAAQAWAAGGTYQVVRKIRMLVEFWDRIGIDEQENLIGRRRDTGAPMDGDHETDKPNFAADPIGEATPLTSHIRLANPRRPDTNPSRILRRPFNYDEGMDPVGNLDMGLLFIAYQASIEEQFATVQKRLAGEPLVDYISPVGGGYFLVLPGVRDATDFLGSSLLA